MFQSKENLETDEKQVINLFKTEKMNKTLSLGFHQTTLSTDTT